MEIQVLCIAFWSELQGLSQKNIPAEKNAFIDAKMPLMEQSHSIIDEIRWSDKYNWWDNHHFQLDDTSYLSDGFFIWCMHQGQYLFTPGGWFYTVLDLWPSFGTRWRSSRFSRSLGQVCNKNTFIWQRLGINYDGNLNVLFEIYKKEYFLIGIFDFSSLCG